MEFDSVLQEIGEFGRYQQLVLILLCIPACFMNSYNAFALFFIAYPSEHRCHIPSKYAGSNVTADKCSLTVNGTLEPCRQWTYDKSYFQNTLVTRFDLVCDYAITVKNVIAISCAVCIFGCLLYSYIQDRWGRRPAFMLNVVTYVVGSAAAPFMPTLVSFAAVRFIASLNGISSWNIGYIWTLEYVGPSKRTLATTVLCVVYALASMSLALVAYWCDTWVQISLVTSLPFVVLLGYYFIIMESPRWLLSKGKNREALLVVERMIKFEGKNLTKQQIKTVLETFEDESLRLTPKQKSLDPSTNPLDLFRTRTMCLKTVLITVIFIANALVYVSIAYNVENLGGNVYMTWVAQASVEAPAALLNLFLLNRFGRIAPLGISMILASIACLLTAPGEHFANWLVISLAVFGKFCICVSYAIIYQLATELFPTVIRGLGIGFGSLIGETANVAMPYVVHSAEAYRMLPMIIMGGVSLVAALASFFLPETLGEHLPETLEDGEMHGKVGWSTFTANVSGVACRKAWARFNLELERQETKV